MVCRKGGNEELRIACVGDFHSSLQEQMLKSKYGVVEDLNSARKYRDLRKFLRQINLRLVFRLVEAHCLPITHTDIERLDQSWRVKQDAP